MSRCPTVRAKQRKNPLLPVDSLAFTVRRVAALPAAHPAEVMASPGVGAAVSSRTSRGAAASPARVLPVAADFPRTPRGEAASPARVLPVAADFPRTPQGVAALPARVLLAAEVLVVALAILTAALAALVQKRIPLAVAARSGEGPAAHPEALVSAVHSPKPLRKWKSLSPVQQEPGRRQQVESLGWELPALNPAQQEWGPAAHSVLLPQNPGTAGICPRQPLRPHQGCRAPARYSRNSAGSPGRTGPRRKVAAPPSTPARQEW